MLNSEIVDSKVWGYHGLVVQALVAKSRNSGSDVLAMAGIFFFTFLLVRFTCVKIIRLCLVKLLNLTCKCTKKLPEHLSSGQ